MAEEMKYHQWDLYGYRRPMKAHVRYPWHRWLNGSMWLLVQGEDFDGETEDDTNKFRRYLLAYAQNHNIRVKTKIAENRRDLYIKAVANTTKQGRKRARHFRRVRERWLADHGIEDDGSRYGGPASDFEESEDDDDNDP